MFVADRVTVAATFDVAATRLAHLINQDALAAPSHAAYEEGLAVIRVGPFGGARGLSKLVRVQWLESVRRGATIHYPLRWEATGTAGDLFPVLDANLTLAPDGDERVHLELIGSYRPPFGRAGVVLDRAIMRRVASATLRSLLADVADAIADPDA